MSRVPHTIGYWRHVSPSYLTWRRAHHPLLNMRIMGSQFVHSHHQLHSYSCSCSKCEQWYFWSIHFLTFRYCLKFHIYQILQRFMFFAPVCFPLICRSFHCVVGYILFFQNHQWMWVCSMLCTVPFPPLPSPMQCIFLPCKIFRIKMLERRSVFCCDVLGNTSALIHVTRNATPIVLGFIFSI